MQLFEMIITSANRHLYLKRRYLGRLDFLIDWLIDWLIERFYDPANTVKIMQSTVS